MLNILLAVFLLTIFAEGVPAQKRSRGGWRTTDGGETWIRNKAPKAPKAPKVILAPNPPSAVVDRDSVDKAAMEWQKEKLQTLDDNLFYLSLSPSEKKEYRKMMQIQGTWRWTFDEWMQVVRGKGQPQVYYRSKAGESNGGVEVG